MAKHSDVASVIDVLRLLLPLVCIALHVEAGRVGTLNNAVKQLEGLSLEGRGLSQELSQQIVCLVCGQEVVDDGTWRVRRDVVWRVQMQRLALPGKLLRLLGVCALRIGIRSRVGEA